MNARCLSALAGTILALLAVAPAAVGGAWAMTTLDALPAAPQADRPVAVGYTIRQHGVSPVDVAGSAIVIRDASGASAVFAGAGEGPVGHHVATVTFPHAGRWTWSARMGWFGEQPLGGVDVTSAGPAGGPGERTADAGWLLLGGALACAALLAGGVAGRRAPLPT